MIDVGNSVALMGAGTGDGDQLDQSPSPLIRFTPADMADCITSGLSGMTLVDALHHHFPSAARGDVYLAIGLAVALLQADLAIAQIENRLLRQHGAKLPASSIAA